MENDNAWVEKLSTRFITGLRNWVKYEIIVNGDLERRYKGNLSIWIKGKKSGDLIEKCKNEIAFSGGAACNAADAKPSHVLTAIGLSPEEARETFRIGFGRFNTEEEVDWAIEILSKNLDYSILVS